MDKAATLLEAPRKAFINMRFEPYSPEKLKELRAEKRLTQDELAQYSGIPLPTIKDWERGKARPSLEKLEVLGEFFGVFFFADWKKNPSEET